MTTLLITRCWSKSTNFPSSSSSFIGTTTTLLARSTIISSTSNVPTWQRRAAAAGGSTSTTLSMSSSSSSSSQSNNGPGGGSLVGKRVLVTGGGRGIGQAIALICHQEGAHVAITSRTRSELDETKALALQQYEEKSQSSTTSSSSLPPSPMPALDCYVTDVTDAQQVDDMVQSLVAQWPQGLDILINNAGMGQSSKGPLETLSSDELQQILTLNVVAVHRVTARVLQHAMLPPNHNNNNNKQDDDDDDPQKTRHIVMISSRAGKVGYPQMSLYVTSKFALEGMTASLAAELSSSSSRRNILVNSLSPGMVHTQSFPKADPHKPGVRSAASVRDGLLALLLQPQPKTGHYLHVDELDQVRAAGLPDHLALKTITEPTFDPVVAAQQQQLQQLEGQTHSTTKSK